MTRISYVNGQYVNHAQAMLHIEDRGCQFSDGVYEVIAFHNRHLLDAEAHYKRLIRSLTELDMTIPMTERALDFIVHEVIRRNLDSKGAAYIQVNRGVARRNHGFPRGIRPTIVVSLLTIKWPTQEEEANGVRIVTCEDIRWGRRDIKSVSLLANIQAKQKAADAGAREAWLINTSDGSITEGSSSNAFMVTKGGTIVTRPADTMILGGVTRSVVLRLAQQAGIPLEERSFSMEEIRDASEAFITGTTTQVLPVRQVDDLTIGNGQPGPVTRQLMTLYHQHIQHQTEMPCAA